MMPTIWTPFAGPSGKRQKLLSHRSLSSLGLRAKVPPGQPSVVDEARCNNCGAVSHAVRLPCHQEGSLDPFIYSKGAACVVRFVHRKAKRG